MQSRAISKPTLRRSADYAYETLIAGDNSIISSPSVATTFDREEDPPVVLLGDERLLSSKSTHDSFYQLSTNTDIVAAIEKSPRRDSTMIELKTSSETEEPKTSDVANHLAVVEAASSAKETQAKPAHRPRAIVPALDDPEGKGCVPSRTNSFDRVYSTDKPHDFSLQASPVKKQDNTRDSLDCSFGVNFKSIDAEDLRSANLHWPFEQRDASESIEASSSSRVPGKRVDPFAPSGFMGLERSVADDLARRLEDLADRLSSLERTLCGTENNTNYTRVSDSTQSDETVHHQPQDMAIFFEGTEMLGDSPLNEDAICPNGRGSAGSETEKFQGGFSVKRLLCFRFFQSNSKRK